MDTSHSQGHSRRLLINSIIELNPTAGDRWLRAFGDLALARYLEHLQFGFEPRGGTSTWVRHPDASACVTRKPAA